MAKKNINNSNSYTKLDSKFGDYNLVAWNGAGVLICIILCYKYPLYLFTIFDSQIFFTGITEVEREINFRTENGLYYSYYKQLVNATSFIKGLYDLTTDNLTEHPSSINILSRMNIYQEVILAFFYRYVPMMGSSPPIFFYVYSILNLHSLLILALYLLPWFLSKSWISGLLCVIFYFFNRFDSTRIDTYMPLRECFAFPFLWMQILCICVYFGSKNTLYDKWYKFGIIASTLFFALFWQFNQFALLLQAISLFICMAFKLIDSNKVKYVLISQLISIILVGILQFMNKMIFSGLLISFITSALGFYYFQKHLSIQKPLIKFCILFFGILFTAFSTLLINRTLKVITDQESDEHINNFVLAKFGFEAKKDFDVYLYLCNGGFEFLDFGYFERLTSNIVFPIYAIVHLVLLVMVVIVAFKLLLSTKNVESFLLSNPEWIYLTIQTALFGFLAIMTLRMKFFWSPLMFVLASATISDIRPWRYMSQLINRNFSDSQIIIVKNSIIIVIMAYLVGKNYEIVRREITELREFYDPDTVELINWINSKSGENTSFTGSMQLMAAVKLGSGHPVSNHPHYEDKVLRLKTKELYCMYGRHDPAHVWKVMKRYRINYMILEDSICLSNKQDGCGLPNILDIVDVRFKGLPVEDLPTRFCDEVRYMIGDYAKYFKSVFVNKTFRIYKVLN